MFFPVDFLFDLPLFLFSFTLISPIFSQYLHCYFFKRVHIISFYHIFLAIFITSKLLFIYSFLTLSNLVTEPIQLSILISTTIHHGWPHKKFNSYKVLTINFFICCLPDGTPDLVYETKKLYS